MRGACCDPYYDQPPHSRRVPELLWKLPRGHFLPDILWQLFIPERPGSWLLILLGVGQISCLLFTIISIVDWSVTAVFWVVAILALQIFGMLFNAALDLIEDGLWYVNNPWGKRRKQSNQ